MKHGLIFTTTAALAAFVIFLAMGSAWIVGRFVLACRWVDRVVDDVFNWMWDD